MNDSNVKCLKEYIQFVSLLSLDAISGSLHNVILSLFFSRIAATRQLHDGEFTLRGLWPESITPLLSLQECLLLFQAAPDVPLEGT